ncbi:MULTISPECIES: nuclear transport factor 2 family protein [Micromonospora]|uniref:nuclear transport factor 2 family protein n=1 Tax=Micromonospora TaxID=1873 RepID=UPI0026735084|nr:nuclear transport factor 2 family protein [Micromonospora sp. HUAS LYJ1]WKU06997.1 nuclear transport factor 2 family protein [Micromonospora sp. HUAS LYJ1]
MTDTSPVAAFFAACDADDLDAAADCFAPDGVWIVAAGPEPGHTYHRKEIPGFLAEIIGKRDELDAAGARMVYGDRVVVADREFLEFRCESATGEVLERGVDVFTLRDGKILVKDVFRKA